MDEGCSYKLGDRKGLGISLDAVFYKEDNHLMKFWDPEVFKTKLKDADVTIEELVVAARRVGVPLSRNTVYNLMRPGGNPTLQYASMFAHMFKCRIDDFLTGRWERVE